MANTYSQIYIQFIFAVKGRESQILESHRERLQQYISGIVRSKEQKLLSIYANPDHIHLLVGFNKLDIKISDFVKEIKSNSSKKINEEKGILKDFGVKVNDVNDNRIKCGISVDDTYIFNPIKYINSFL